MVRAVFCVMILSMLYSCKNWYQLPDGSLRPKKTALKYSKLYNKDTDKLGAPIVYKLSEIQYYDFARHDYLKMNRDSNYNFYLVLLNNGRCFTNSLAKAQQFDSHIYFGERMSIGYYRKEDDLLELEIFGTSNGGFFGYEHGKMYNDSLILFSEKNHKGEPQYIKKYHKSGNAVSPDKVRVDW